MNARLEGQNVEEVTQAALETKEQKLVHKEALGREARAVLEQPMVVDYLDKYGEMLWKQFLKTAPEDTGTLQMIRLQRGAMERFIEDMNRFVSDGRVAEAELAQTRDAIEAARKRAA
jgi:hypothetical protein